MNINIETIKDYDENNKQSTTNVIQNKAKVKIGKRHLKLVATKDYENMSDWTLGENKPNSKPNFKSEDRREKWNVSHNSSDFYYRTMRKSRAQIYDELLVIKCQQGDREAFDELVGRWQKRLWHYAYRVTGSESAAWDVVQETWFAIIKGLSKLKDAAGFPRWVFRILNNKCADWLRKEYLRSRLNNQFVNQAQNELDKKQNTNEKTESLRAAIAKLSPERRALLTLRYREGFDIGQIAEILNIPEGTVKSRLHRTLDQLRQIVGRYQNG
ncbi:MAG: RNA polymerase sigma factor [Planctomycetota bacterium]